MSNKLKGVWVDGGVWEHEPFSLLEKHLFQKISDLDNEKGCTAMNAWFADFLGISKSRVSQLISGFKKAKLIKIDLKYKGKEIVGRVINLKQGGMLLTKEGMLQQNTPMSGNKHPYVAGSVVSNINLSNIVKEYKEREKRALSQIEFLESENQKLKEENLILKNQEEKGKEKSSEKKEKRIFPSNAPRKAYTVEVPQTESQITKPYQVFLNSYPFDKKGWSEGLKQIFLTYCEVKDENSHRGYSSTQMKLRIAEINQAIENHEMEWIEKLVTSGANGGWADFQFDERIKARKLKQKKDEAKHGDKYSEKQGTATDRFRQAVADGHYDTDDSPKNASWAREMFKNDNEGAEQHFD